MLSSTERSFILSLCSIILVVAANLGDGLSRQQLSSLDLNSLASNDIDTDQKVIRIVMLHVSFTSNEIIFETKKIYLSVF